MSTRSYLKHYGLDKRRILQWIKSQHGSTFVARKALADFAIKNRKFNTGADIERAVLDLSHSRIEESEEAFKRVALKMTLWEKIKWLWTRQR